jgi:hypothetical protein
MYTLENKVFRIITDQASNMKKAFKDQLEAIPIIEQDDIVESTLELLDKNKQKSQLLQIVNNNEISADSNSNDFDEVSSESANILETSTDTINDATEELSDSDSNESNDYLPG